jgi:hypothetical protein
MKFRRQIITAIALSALMVPAIGMAGDFFIYPSKGQSQEQQKKDEFECYQWAKGQTGFDPMAAPRASSPPPASEAEQGGLVRGAARGALTGLAIGAIAGDAGKGAAIGAAGGGLIGGMRRNDQARREEQKRQQWAQDQSNQYAAQRNSYNRAYIGCLEGRGYSVK